METYQVFSFNGFSPLEACGVLLLHNKGLGSMDRSNTLSMP